MLPSATSPDFQPTLENEHLTPRRIRHVTGIQIRNLTPFPVRDAFTSALNQPVSNLDASGITDEPGAALTSVRSRRASNATRRSQKREDGVVEQDIIVPADSRGRKPSTSRITFTNVSTSPNNSTQRFPTSKSNYSLRSNRTRTNSVTSSTGNQRLGSSTSSLSNSQASLEKVIGSRLVETFIVISMPSTPYSREDTLDAYRSKSSRSAPASKSTFGPPPPSTRLTPKTQRHSRGGPSSSSRSNGRLPAHPNLPNKLQGKVGPRVEDKTTKITSPRQIGAASLSKSTSLSKGRAGAPLPVDEQHVMPASPTYFSPIHRPSTNPFFAIDTRLGSGFSNHEIVGQFMKVEVWGKMASSRRLQETNGNIDNSEWKLLDDWDIDVNKLIPLPDDLDGSAVQLPSNTLVVTLEPPGQNYYFPSSSRAVSRPRSSSVGYSSDPESEIRKVKQVTEQQQPDSAVAFTQASEAPLLRKRHHRVPGSANAKEPAKTASWQELFNVTNLQSLIADTQVSLDKTIKNIHGVLENDESFPLRHALSERESRIRELRNNHCTVLDRIAQRKQELAERSQRLADRAELLSSASEVIAFDAAANVEIEDHRNQLVELRQQTTSIQTSLISSLSMIYPIELYSSNDLLFTILDVPLPIPVTPNDPAPPLTLPKHKDVTEETVATALGYVAQVVQLLAAYTETNLVYPVTCIGSRSLIRDGISAMVGPRMFPLFSRGVDTYRFEYGVFLLNKNIEMLMSERNLRALDMRHTLPNLKNLLLTLSHDLPLPAKTPPLQRPPPSTVDSSKPLRESSSNEEVRTPKASHTTPSLARENTSPPESGANTPTAPTDESRKGKSFLGFVPFTDFLRVRYPSHSSEKTIRKDTTAALSEEMSEDAAEDEDCPTIHAVCPEVGNELGDRTRSN